MADVFISYARSTAEQARAVGEALGAAGYSVWRDADLPSHRAYADVIEEQLGAAKVVLVIWSAEAVKSHWVRSEADRARAGDKLVQLSVDSTPLPMPFDQIQCARLADWRGDTSAPAWRSVVDSIAELTGRAPAAAGRRPSPPTAKTHSICVLPFANMSGDPEQEYFSDGISEDIITDLSKVSALQVASRNTAFSYKGKLINVGDVARELRVGHVLEGSVRKSGIRVRITAQLIEGASDSHVWAERYDRDLNDIFALQDEISQAIVAALKLKLLPEEKVAIHQRGTANAEAYDIYLMARQYLDTGNQGDRRREEAIVRLCRRATELDPGYARAWALLGLAQSMLADTHGGTSDDGSAAAERALMLDPHLAEPHLVRAKTLETAGRADEAFAEVELALQFDPESREAHGRAGAMHLTARRFNEAARHLRTASGLSETQFSSAGMLISVMEALGDADGVRWAAETTLDRVTKVLATDRNNGGAISFGVIALVALGQVEQAKDWMRRAMLVEPDNMVMRYNFGCVACRSFQDFATALEFLEPAFKSRPAWFSKIAKGDPDLDLLRDDPGFQAIMAAAEASAAAAS
jgi:adenylate cyclase